MLDPDDVKLVNCARCDRELLGESMRGHVLPWTCEGMPLIGGRVNQRPYCVPCLRVMRVEDCEGLEYSHSGNVAVRRGRVVDDDDPMEQYAVRLLEDSLGE